MTYEKKINILGIEKKLHVFLPESRIRDNGTVSGAALVSDDIMQYTRRAINHNIIREPEILTANTYYWCSGINAKQRRENELTQLCEVKRFFESLQFEVTAGGYTVEAEKTISGDIIAVAFDYNESCANVYKHFKVWKNGKKSNIRTIRGILKKINAVIIDEVNDICTAHFAELYNTKKAV